MNAENYPMTELEGQPGVLQSGQTFMFNLPEQMASELYCP